MILINSELRRIIMAKKIKYERTCTVCGNHYIFCTRGCGESNVGPELWHDAYDRLLCKELFNITCGYLNNWLAPEVEAARLKEFDSELTDEYLAKIPQWMQDAVKELRKLDTQNAAAINAVLKDEPVKEVKVEEVKEEKIEEVKSEETKSEEKPVEKTANKTPKPKYNNYKAKKSEN